MIVLRRQINADGEKKRLGWTEELVAIHCLDTSGVYRSSGIVLPRPTVSTLQHKTIL